ncbi:ArsR family transcriptional regulator [Halalkalicoccus tibetensis]|uniref:ArsR family transcriptional regulator n=1 Tax=Halalkalicoccus tibetensis TaxID=175632 RepID=A0ABD5V3X3_9EURY
MVSDQKTVIADLPPSSKLVYYVLKNEGEMTKRQIIAESRLSEQTTRLGLERLESSNIVVRETANTSEKPRGVYSLV